MRKYPRLFALALAAAAVLLIAAAAGKINWTQLNPLSRHGTGSLGQSSDGTGASGHFAAFDANGNITDGGTGGSGTNYQTLGIGGTSQTQRGRLNLIQGTGVTISNSDNAGTNSSDVTITASGGSGGGITILEQHTASSSAELDFTAWESATYDHYLIDVIDLQVSVGAAVEIQCSTNGGTSYDTAANYSYAFNFAIGSGTTGGFANTAATFIALRDTNADTSGHYPISGHLDLYGPASSAFKLFVTDLWSLNATDTPPSRLTGSQAYKSTSTVNAFRVLPASGTLSSGTVRVYGVAH